MSTANSIPVDKRRTSPAVARCRKAEKYRKTLWRHRLQGWLRQLPRWLMHKTSLSALVEAQVKARTEQLFRQANYDALTHLPNRAFFMQTMENTFKQAEHTQTPFALLFLDLDGFKPVNDTFGHSAGDELLRMVAARLIASIRDDDFVARLGGDEFVILLRNVVDREIIETISKRLIQEISRPYWVDGRTVHISTSVGISEHPHDGKTAAQLIENADQALYAAKRQGRKQFCFYQSIQQMPEVAPDRLQSRFEVDVAHHKLTPYFRPITDLRHGRCIGARLNLRWQNAPIDSPWYEAWQQLLHRSQWSLSVGLWMIESAAYYRSQWGQLPTDFFISAPLDMSLLLEDDPAELLIQRIKPYGVPPAQIELRIELDSVYKLDQKAIHSTRSLHQSGFRLRFSGLGRQSLDLSLLSQTAVHAIALDGRWVQQQLNQAEGIRWVRALIAMAAGIDAQAHVDEIADKTQGQLLSRLGVHSGEGPVWTSYLTDKAFAAYLAQQLATDA